MGEEKSAMKGTLGEGSARSAAKCPLRVYISRAALPDALGEALPLPVHAARARGEDPRPTKDLTTYACQQTYSHYPLMDVKGVGSQAIHFNCALLSTPHLAWSPVSGAPC